MGCECESIMRFVSTSQVYLSTVTLLTDKQLKELGVIKMGDRANLRTLCKNVERCKKTSTLVTLSVNSFFKPPWPLVCVVCLHAALKVSYCLRTQGMLLLRQ